MKKFILSVMMFVMAGTMNLFAQSQEYIDAIGKLMATKAVESFSKEDIKPELVKILTTAGVENNAEVIVEKYFDTQFTEDMKYLMAEYYYKSITLDELKLIEESSKNTELKSIFEKNKESSKKMEDITQAYLITGVMTLTTGGDIPAPDLNPEISKSYLENVKKLNNASNAVSMIEKSKSSIMSAFDSQIEDENSKAMLKEMLNKMFDCLTKNYDTLSAEAYFYTLTEEDLIKLIDYYNTPAGIAQKKANDAMAEDILGVGLKLINNFNSWYEKQK